MKKISEEAIREFDKTYKVALVATIDDEGEPHISLITSLKANGEIELTTGEFITGISKEFMQKRSKVGFFVMSLDKNWWSGTAVWKDKKTSGEEYEAYNQIPMFRYNSYFGIHTVHFYDLESITEMHKLDMAGVIFNALINVLIKPLFKSKKSETALTAWAYKLMKGIATLKFISYIGEDGFPQIVPVIQASARSKSRIVLPLHPYSNELSNIKSGTKVAVMGLNLDMENVLIKGTFTKHSFKTGVIDIERVYNSMPPKHGYIYP